MLDPGWNSPQARRLDQFDDPLGPRVGGDIKIGDLFAQECVPHTAADEPRLMPAPDESLENRAGWGGG
jgi:hypothetical protein